MTQTQAEEIRHEVIRKLGPDWTGRVWYNLGWHVAWNNGALKLNYDNHTQRFWAVVGDVDDPYEGHLDLAQAKTKYSKDPIKAILAACENAQKVFIKRWELIQFSVTKIVLELSALSCRSVVLA